MRRHFREVRELSGGTFRTSIHDLVAGDDHVVALVEELDGGRLHAGDRVALVALASGLEIGVVLFTVDEGLEGCRADRD